MTTVPTTRPTPRPINGLRLQLYIITAMLAIEVALGVYVNLYAKLPTSDKGTSGFAAFAAAIASGPVSLALHAIVGTLILLAAISVIIRGIATRRAPQIILAIVGLLAVLAAWGSGTGFVGNQVDAASFAMTIGTVIALLSYATAVFNLRASATTHD
jgi:hypothetical protein